MSIELSERTVGLWFMSVDDKIDWMGSVESLPDGRFHLSYRFRYHGEGVEDPYSPENKDEKNWYGATFNGSKAHAIKAVQIVVSVLEQRTGRQCSELLVRNGDIAAFMKKLSAQEWAHVRTGKDAEQIIERERKADGDRTRPL